MWKITPGRYFNTGKLNLSIGSAKTHLGAEIWQAFADVIVKIVYCGMTPLFQFLDTHLN